MFFPASLLIQIRQLIWVIKDGEFTIRELAEKVIELTGSGSKLNIQPLPDDDLKQCKPDIGLAQEELGWEPKIALDEGLPRTIEYFEEYLKGEG